MSDRTHRSTYVRTEGPCEVGLREDVYTYTVDDTALEHGTSLGNAHGWATSKGTGAIESLFSTDIGMEVTGSLVVNFFASYRDIREYGEPEQAHGRTTPETIVRLAPSGGGHFTIHPAYQEHVYDLIGNVHVEEDFFLPNTGTDDKTSALQVLRIENRAREDRKLFVVGCLYLPGQTGRDIQAQYDEEINATVAWNDAHPDWVRAFGSIPSPDAYVVTHDLEMAYAPRQTLANSTGESGEVFASLQCNLYLKPGEKKEIAFVIAFTPEGRKRIREVYKSVCDHDRLFGETIGRYRDVLSQAHIATPDALINQGAQWCKANMLRVLARYPTGIGFTNDPGKSSKAVARDSAWFVYGSDYILPEASCDILASFAHRQEDSGMMIEYYDALTDERDDYGLNINDNTPLFILACSHHIDITGHGACLDRLYPVLVKAAEYILSQEDDRGLVYCSAEGTAVEGIAGWRNIIPNRSISGAVTEINAESYAALMAVSRLARRKGDNERAEYFMQKAGDLRRAINHHLINPNNGMYFLNIDTHGNPVTEVTSDEVFPMIFGVADDDTSRRIQLRLSNSDFMTSAGLRTVSSLDPFYSPDRLIGMHGGVWPGVTWWYAMAAAKHQPSVMVNSLKRSYNQYIVHPPAYNTVPGQFSEWFDGESLVNHGMRLSPWEPPRFLWAMIEGAIGLDVSDDEVNVNPRIPYEWTWLRVRNLRAAGNNLEFFVVRLDGDLAIYTACKPIRSGKVELFDREITQHLAPLSVDTIAAAYERDGDITVCLGNAGANKIPAPFCSSEIIDRKKQYRVRTYQSETGRWVDVGTHRGDTLDCLSIEVEPYGFVIFEFAVQ